MLNWMLSTLSPERARERGRQAALRVADAETFLGRRIAEMQPVGPERASNDDAMAPIYDEVERDLKRAGYLRSA